MDLKNDWRYTHQDRYLTGLVFTLQVYAPAKGNDHDHCEFCMAKFSNTLPDALASGWASTDRRRWICEKCFEDFSKPLNLSRK